MEIKILLRAQMSLVRIRTQIKNKIHSIVDRNKDSYTGLENQSDIFGKTGIRILRETKINPIDYRVLNMIREPKPGNYCVFTGTNR